jgi:hypothetical protein
MKFYIGIITVHDYEMHETYIYETKVFKSNRKTKKAIEILMESVKKDLLTELEEAGYSSGDGDDDDLLKENYCIDNSILDIKLNNNNIEL